MGNMRKSVRLIALLLALMALLLTGSVLMAQDAVEAPEAPTAEVLAEIVVPALEAYNENLPQGFGTIKVDDFVVLLAENPDVVILDIREAGEVEETGVIEGSIHIPMRELGENMGALPELDATIVVVCKGGFRAGQAMAALQILGYENAKVLSGGFDAWVGEELPVVDEPVEFEVGDVPEDIDPDLLQAVSYMLATVPEGFGGVKPADLSVELIEDAPELLLDVRTAEEWADPGYIEGAVLIPIAELMTRTDELPEDMDAPIVVYCAAGTRGGIAMTMLRTMGYTNVRNLSGGINGWIAAELPVVQD
jgi:rhodanese-related sulfurtransferase